MFLFLTKKKNMKDKICLITGATSGIGEVTATELAKRGATIVMVARNKEKAENVQRKIIRECGHTNVNTILADLSSLAQVHLGAGDWALAEEQSRHALGLLDGRADFLDEIGNAQIVLGRSLLEQGRLEEAETALAEAEQSLSQLSSASHRALAWTAQGDLASRRGEDRSAAALYRRAAQALQDVSF
jgi:NAD(P)-dependent dehydrogenase (short-subunit alcohol dehydrogenase family)